MQSQVAASVPSGTPPLPLSPLQSVHHSTTAKLYRIHFVCFPALYRECKTPEEGREGVGGVAGREEEGKCCARVLAAGQTRDKRRTNIAPPPHPRDGSTGWKSTPPSACSRARAGHPATPRPFHPSVSIHLLSVACLPSCMITRAVVKVLSTGRDLVGSPLPAHLSAYRALKRRYRRIRRYKSRRFPRHFRFDFPAHVKDRAVTTVLPPRAYVAITAGVSRLCGLLEPQTRASMSRY